MVLNQKQGRSNRYVVNTAQLQTKKIHAYSLLARSALPSFPWFSRAGLLISSDFHISSATVILQLIPLVSRSDEKCYEDADCEAAKDILHVLILKMLISFPFRMLYFSPRFLKSQWEHSLQELDIWLHAAKSKKSFVFTNTVHVFSNHSDKRTRQSHFNFGKAKQRVLSLYVITHRWNMVSLVEQNTCVLGVCHAMGGPTVLLSFLGGIGCGKFVPMRLFRLLNDEHTLKCTGTLTKPYMWSRSFLSCSSADSFTHNRPQQVEQEAGDKDIGWDVLTCNR